MVAVRNESCLQSSVSINFLLHLVDDVGGDDVGGSRDVRLGRRSVSIRPVGFDLRGESLIRDPWRSEF